MDKHVADIGINKIKIIIIVYRENAKGFSPLQAVESCTLEFIVKVTETPTPPPPVTFKELWRVVCF